MHVSCLTSWVLNKLQELDDFLLELFTYTHTKTQASFQQLTSAIGNGKTINLIKIRIKELLLGMAWRVSRRYDK